MKAHRIRLLSMALAVLGSVAACSAAELPHYALHGDSIAFWPNANDEDLKVLDRHPELRNVALPGVGAWDDSFYRAPVKVTDVGFTHIANCKNLETLLLGFDRPLQVTDDGLKSIEGLRQLRVIQLGATPFTSAGLSHLAGLTNLEALSLDQNALYDDSALDSIANLRKLRVLRFYGAPITDAGIARIAGLSQLENLQLAKSRVGDNSLKIIGGFVRLKTLDLQYTRVTDAGMEHLKSLTKLQWLYLKGTAVGPRGLTNLQSLPDLALLYLDLAQGDTLPPKLATKLWWRAARDTWRSTPP